MLKTIEAIVEGNTVRLLEPVSVSQPTRALVTLLESGDTTRSVLFAQEHRAWLDVYAAYVGKHGVFSDGLRSF
ncbi:MAG: hypothetical protein HY066_16555 [Betaproteobacteria bacterium]|nr:hypothetical protein [Betaproteobacteria bacterium]